jgi:hypothetical protein
MVRDVNLAAVHPPADQLEAAAFGWLSDGEARGIRGHAARCPTCSRLLALDDAVRQRLISLRGREPRIEVLGQVVRRIDPGLGTGTGPDLRASVARRPLLISLVAAALLAIVVTAGSVVAATRPRSNYDYGQGVYLETTLPGAQAQTPFHILQPTVLPPGYALSTVQVPNPASVPHAEQYQKLDVYVDLIYRDPSSPTSMLSIDEQPAGRPTMVNHALPGTTEYVVVDGQRATYLKGVTAQHPGTSRDFVDYSQNALVIERSGVVAEIVGSPGAGVDRAELLRIAASLH